MFRYERTIRKAILHPSPSQSYRNTFLAEELFYIPDSISPEMKNAGGEHGVGFAFKEYIGHVFQCAGTAARDYRNADRFADAARDGQIESGFGAVGVDGIQNNFTGAECDGFFCPVDGIETGVFAAAVREDTPFFW